MAGTRLEEILRNAGSTVKDSAEQKAREILNDLKRGLKGKVRGLPFGSYVVGPEPRYDSSKLLPFLPRDIADSRRKTLADYTLQVFEVPVYVKGTSLQDALSVELRRLMDKGRIPNLNEALNIAEAVAYQVLSSASVPDKNGQEAGISYKVQVTAMIPKISGAGYSVVSNAPALGTKGPFGPFA